MEQELVDLENLSDLENLLAIAEDEFCIKGTGKVKMEDDCEILSVKTARPSPLLQSISNSFTLARKQVQSSISHFFKPPKRLPDEETIKVEGEEDVIGNANASFKRVKATTFTNAVTITNVKNKFKLPKFKLIPGTPFAVDAFSYGPIEGITGYFLTHFHSDHYKGLSNKFFAESSGIRLYCSEVTGKLVQKELKIRRESIMTLKVGQMYEIEGIKVGLLDANQ